MHEEVVIKPKKKAAPRKKKEAVPVEMVTEAVEAAPVEEIKVEEPAEFSLPDFVKYGTVLFHPTFSPAKPIKVVVVGCGGTGSRLIPLLSQHIANHNASNIGIRKHYKANMELALIDMDIVEDKNLTRQNFFKFDVNKNKAVAMAERYSSLFGITIQAFTGKFEEVCNDLTRTVDPEDQSTQRNWIIFDCTDNVKARKSIEECFPHYGVIVSCGNEDKFGQVLISTTAIKTQSIKHSIRALDLIRFAINNPDMGRITRVGHLPTLLNLFRGFRDTETASCVELNIEEQSMPINSLVAHLAYNVFYQITSDEPITYWMCKCNVNNGYTTHYITNPKEALKHVLRGLLGFYSPDADERFAAAFEDYEKIYSQFHTDGALSKISEFVESHGVFCYPMIKMMSTLTEYFPTKDKGSFDTILSNLEEEIIKLGA